VTDAHYRGLAVTQTIGRSSLTLFPF
jgi:hypothetical protein